MILKEFFEKYFDRETWRIFVEEHFEVITVQYYSHELDRLWDAQLSGMWASFDRFSDGDWISISLAFKKGNKTVKVLTKPTWVQTTRIKIPDEVKAYLALKEL
ncbi:MAG: hypothetical protein ACTSPB_24810 [Candidatus Thorarchaeota archaeon]